MGINDIRLNPTLLGHLYKDVMLVDGISASKAVLPAAAAHPFLGKNGKRICLLVAFPGVVFLPDHHLQFIVRILEACKLSLEDVAILNLSANALDPQSFFRQMKPETILLFGIPPGLFSLSRTLPFFEIGKIDNRSFLNTPSLDEMNLDTEAGKMLKGKLWSCLKTIFAV